MCSGLSDNFYIKQEDEILSADDTSHAEISQVQREKCGEVFIVSGNFILICSCCNNSYDNMLDFGGHVREKHLAIDDDDDIEKNVTVERVDIVKTEVPETWDTKSTSEDTASSSAEENVQEAANDDGNQSADSEKAYFELLNFAKKAACKKKPKLYCPECQKHYTTPKLYHNHISQVHNGRAQEILSCKYCDQEFATIQKISQHIATHKRPNPYQCPHCTFACGAPNERDLHVTSHHLGIRPFQCAECSRGFATQNRLKIHLLTHNIGGTLECKFCGKKFIQHSRLEYHLRIHTDERPVQCELCGRKFRSKSTLTEHMKRHTDTRNYQCDACVKKFYSKTMLREHYVTHTGERSFQCPECGQAFGRKKNLKTHQQLHSNHKAYTCEMCGKSFAQYAGLYGHKKTHVAIS